jgi:uncharacterized membrane protein YgcG
VRPRAAAYRGDMVVTVVIGLIVALVVMRLISALMDRKMRSPDGVDLAEETFEDRYYAAQRALRPYHSLPVWHDPNAGGSLWYEGGDPGASGGDGDFDSGPDGGGGDFGGGDSG